MSITELQKWLKTIPLDLTATIDAREAYAGADYVIIATPTDYDPETNVLRHFLRRSRDQRM